MTRALLGARRLAAALLLCACTHTPIDEATATAEAGYGRVFGRIELIEQEAWRANVSAWQKLTLFARSTGSPDMHFFTVQDDGSFYWPLKAGEYELLGLQMDRAANAGRPRPVRLATAFSVARGEAVYIGDVQVVVERKRDHFRIIDRSVDARRRVEDKVAESKLGTGIALMRLESRTARYREVTEICVAPWGLECSDTHQGVIPVEPADTAWTYPEVKSLSPLLEWKPSSRSGITYDVAVYESLSFMHTATTSVRDLPGALVAYAEGLREPRWSPPSLQPGRLYQWTVRLRDGDTVSSWSTTEQHAAEAFLFTPFVELLMSGAPRRDPKYFGFQTLPQ
ncbi:MAG TPA: hypothetical protein VJQ58_04795 [Burkholderiales bacterium]|nr:hypothetical protein [Burkholderiales bacterium]